MASLTTSPVVTAGSSGVSSRKAINSVSSLRVRAFTPARKNLQHGMPHGGSSNRLSVRPKAAEVAAPAPAAEEEGGEFEFNYADAKKANEWQASDVENAIKWYQDGDGVEPDYDRDFVTNYYDNMEDASYFDDIDNNEGYEQEEYLIAGIPEAAPKKRGRARKGEEDAADDEDVTAQAKAASRMQSVEDDMVLAAQMEEMGFDQQDEAGAADGSNTWDWENLADEQDEEDAAGSLALATAGAPRRAVQREAIPTDAAVFSDLRLATGDGLDAESKDVLDFLLDDFDFDGTLANVGDLSLAASDDDLAAPEEEVDASLADIDALLAEDISIPAELDAAIDELRSIPDASGRKPAASLDVGAVEEYMALLEATQPSELSAEEVDKLFSVEGTADYEPQLEGVNEAGDEQLLAPITVAELTEAELDVPTLPAEDGADGSADVDDLAAELAALKAEGPAETIAIDADELEVLDQYLSAATEFNAANEARMMEISERVAAGELPEAALEEALEVDVVDAENDLLEPSYDDEEEANGAGFDDDEDDGEQWLERIIELNRVTKVVKGGKIMGFRCTAIVGNQNGLVGVGCRAGRDVQTSVRRALIDAKKNIIVVDLVGAGTVPHRSEAKFHSAGVLVLPAAEGTGVLAGGSIRSVLELAGVQNVLAKRLGCRSPLNNARCTIRALQQMNTLYEVARYRGVPMSNLLLPSSK